MDIINLLFGKPLSSETLEEQRLAKYKALPVFSSDALSSVAYATEEILHVLVLAGIAAMSLCLPIAIAICILIGILAISYRQTIFAYPNGGGAFTVARENLGEGAGLIAAAALLIDYVLTVAVSVTAGVHAVVSAFPNLFPHAVSLSIIAVAIIAIMNLRGVRESATAFALPTYAFIFLILILIVMGSYGVYTGHIPPHHIPGNNRPHLSDLVQPVALLLILRAFSAGCTAMTGIECVANGVPVFEKPEPRNAAMTLVMLATLLIVMFFGVTYLADHLMLVPEAEQSILSQVAHKVFGDGVLYYGLQFATMAILLLAANTSFAGFPRLASILAEKKYLPKQLTSLGDRLSFSNGVVLLAVISGALIVIFHGETHLLIPLYAVGVFSAFSLSQLGMVSHWLRKKTRRWKMKAFINGLGFVATTVALAVIVESKFVEGAWLVVICVPVLLMGFYKIHYHYVVVDRELSMTTHQANQYLDKISGVKPKVILPVSRIHRGTLAALNFAQSVSDDVTAVAVALEPAQIRKLESEWKSLNIHVPLVILESPYRAAIEPLKKFIRQQDNRAPERGLCMLVFPQAIPTRWWHDMLHNQRSLFLKASLMFNRKHKGGTRIFVDVPYQLER